MERTMQERSKLKRVLSRSDVMALSFGTMIGWGWLVLPGEWIARAGFLGALIALLIGCGMCILVGLTYAELTTALPITGGELTFTYRGLGYFFSWIAGWAISFAYIGVAAWEGIAISTAIDSLFDVPQLGYLWTVVGYEVYFSWAAMGMIGAIILTILNIIGVKPSAIFQLMGTLGLVAVGIIFLSGSAAFGDGAYVGKLFTSTAGIGAVLLVVPSMFVGFDVIPQSSEEMKMPLKDIAKVLIFSIVLAGSWYILMTVGIAFSLPPEQRIETSIPLADAATYSYLSPTFGKILVVGGVCGILTSWNGFFVGASRVLFAMGRARMLPAFFAKIHPRYQTPYASLGFVGGICLIAPLLGRNALVWFVNTAALGTVVSYLLVAISFLVIRNKEPDLSRPFKVKHWKIIGAGAIGASLFLLSLFTPINVNLVPWSYEWFWILLWTMIGIGFAVYTKVKWKETTKSERELLLFGEEYAREEYL